MLTYSFEGHRRMRPVRISLPAHPGGHPLCGFPRRKKPSKRAFAKHLGGQLITIENATRPAGGGGAISIPCPNGAFCPKLEPGIFPPPQARYESQPIRSVSAPPEHWFADLVTNHIPAENFPSPPGPSCGRC